jgi:prevent-host-death family protein
MYIMYMRKGSASVADLRKQLARVLRLVENGREVIVTRHGEGVAKLVPVRDGAELLAASGVRPAERSGRIPRIRPSRRGLRRSLTRAVLEDRE